jgi:hypothetical protein
MGCPVTGDGMAFYFRNNKQGDHCLNACDSCLLQNMVHSCTKSDACGVGAGPCAVPSCIWGPSCLQKGKACERTGGCLAGACAEPTIANVGTEVADIRAWLPAARPLIVGFYATGHSSLGAICTLSVPLSMDKDRCRRFAVGSPSARYVRGIIPVILSQPGM